jgi:hypothetical protein
MNAESSHLGLEELIAEANGDLADDRVRAHLAACPDCRAEAGRWGAIARGVRHLVAATPSILGPAGDAGGRRAELAAPRRRRPRVLAASKPRRALVAAGTVAALAAGALTAAGVTGAFGSGSGQQIQTAAYITQVKHALATQAEEGLVSYSRTVLPAGSAVEPRAGGWSVGPGVHSPMEAAVMVAWEYQYSTTYDFFTAAGQPTLAEQITVSGQEVTTVAVSYREATWWRSTQKPGMKPPRPGCGTQNDNAWSDPGSNGWPAYIRQELSCGVYQQDGRQRVDGIDAVKLELTGTRGGGLVMWINPATYLPVRQAFLPVSSAPEAQPTQTDFLWSPATAASLAHLRVSVPAGFRQVQRPAWPR